MDPKEVILMIFGIVLVSSLLTIGGCFLYFYKEDKELERKWHYELMHLKNLRSEQWCLDSIDRALDDALFWNNLSSIYLNAGLDDEGRLYYSMAHDILEGITGRRMKPYGYIPRGVEICKVG